MMQDAGGARSSRKLVSRSMFLNLLGLGLPMVAAVGATPPLIHTLGAERYGVLTVAWGLIGYFTLLDLGLGRAVIKGIVDRRGTERDGEIPGFIWTSVYLLTALGLVGTFLALPVAFWVAGGGLRVPAEFRGEARDALVLLALSLPFVIGTTGLRCALEGYNLFGVANAIRVPTGIFSFVGPLLVLPFSHRLGPVVGILVAGRVAGWVAHLVACLAYVPALRGTFSASRRFLAELFRFGGWLTVSTVASMLMTYLDRFVIGAMISMAAVAYFATPFDMLQRIAMLPGALVTALFPTVAAGLTRGGGGDEESAAAVFGWSMRSVLAALLPVVLVLVTLSREGLELWLGREFAMHAAGVMQWVSVGVLVNALGMVGATGVQGANRPDLTGKLNLAELPLYLGALWLLLRVRGVEGAAIAWTLRVTVDTAAIMMMSARVAPATAPVVRRVSAGLLGSFVLCAVAASLSATSVRLAFLAVTLPVYAVVAWKTLLLEEERRGIAALASRAQPRRSPLPRERPLHP